MKKQFRASHPDWDDKRVSEAAYGTATNVWKKKHGKSPQEMKMVDKEDMMMSEEEMAKKKKLIEEEEEMKKKKKPEVKSYHFSENIEVKDTFVSGVLSSINKDLGNDSLSLDCLKQMAEIINSKGIPLGYDHWEILGERANICPIGRLTEAQVDESCGKLFVKGKLNDALSVYPEALKSIQNGNLTAFSIEYQINPFKTSTFVADGQNHRLIGGLNSLIGAALTSRPMNKDSYLAFQQKHAETRFDEEEDKDDEFSDDEVLEGISEYEKKNIKQTNVEVNKMEEKVEVKAQEAKVEVKSEVIDYAKLAAEIKNAMQPEKSPQTIIETKSMSGAFVEFKSAVLENKGTINEQWKAAAKMHNERFPSWRKTINSTSVRDVGAGHFQVKGKYNNELKFELKASLEHDTNKTSDTDYYQNAAELNDIYDPVVINALNDKTTLYGLLEKKDASGFGDRYGFRIRYGRNTSASNYDEGATLTADPTNRLKCQIPFMWYSSVVQVTGQMIAAASGKGGIGDIYADEVKWATADLLVKLNQDLFDTSSPSAGMTPGGQFLSLVQLGDSTTYTTIYGHTRSSFTGLASGGIDSSTTTMAQSALRTAIRTVEANGAERANLIIVTSFKQRDAILALKDNYQYTMNSTNFNVGWEGLPMHDGIPIHADQHCPDGYLWVLDKAHTYFAVQLAPTYEDLAKTDDSKKGFIKTYLALVCEVPNHTYLFTNFA